MNLFNLLFPERVEPWDPNEFFIPRIKEQLKPHDEELERAIARLMKSGIEYETDHDHISTCHKTFLYTVHNKHGNYYICSFCGHTCDIFIRN